MVPKQRFSGVHPDAAAHFSLDTVLHLLGQPTRRALLACLYQRDKPLAVADVSKEIVWRTSSKSRSNVTAGEAENCYLSLHHRDIPKLAEYGVVTMDVEDNTVTLTERGEALVQNQDNIIRQEV